MSDGGWDDPWRRYPASVPLPAKGGLVTSKQRGAMAATWWSRRFLEVLESYGLGARLARGRRYARAGQVLNLDVGTAVITSEVQGSRRTPYLVRIALPELSARQWRAIDEAMSTKVGFLARLLAGELPPDLEEVFQLAGVSLFPHSWTDLRSDCSCPDGANPCKHIASVLYVFADRLDDDPWLVLAWRGRTRDQILEPLRAGRADHTVEEIAPWWPFAPGLVPALGDGRPGLNAELGGTDDPDAVLDALEPLAVQIGKTSFLELLRPTYEHIVGAQDPAQVLPIEGLQ
jgi:uncharacterized Zn finger protein